MVPTSLGEAAYLAYGEAVGFENYQGLPMPTWDELPDRIQGAWHAAARGVQEQIEGYLAQGEDVA
jgi:hypothetical protein